jgi:hypothetical protein
MVGNNAVNQTDYLGWTTGVSAGFAFGPGNITEGDDTWLPERAAQGTDKKRQGQGKSGEALLNFLQQMSSGENCIERLNLASHGGSARLGGTLEGASGLIDDLDTGNDPFLKRDDVHEKARDVKNDLKKMILDGGIEFCCKCEIWIMACRQELLPAALAEVTGCTIVAVDGGQCNPGSDKNEWQGNFKKWTWNHGDKEVVKEPIGRVPSSVKGDPHADIRNVNPTQSIFSQ